MNSMYLILFPRSGCLNDEDGVCFASEFTDSLDEVARACRRSSDIIIFKLDSLTRLKVETTYQEVPVELS